MLKKKSNLLGIFLAWHEHILPRHEPQPWQAALVDRLLVHQGHGSAQLVIEEPQGIRLKKYFILFCCPRYINKYPIDSRTDSCASVGLNQLGP